jgi:hypothetical protein
MKLLFYFDISLSVVHGSEDIIASGAGDDAICLFAKEKSNMVSYHPIYTTFSHDFNLMWHVLTFLKLYMWVMVKI